MSANLLVLEGTLNNEPEFKATSTGKTLANFEISVPQYKGEAFVFKITAWNDLAESLRGLPQGAKLTVYGRVTQRKYEWQGAQKTSNEFVANSLDIRPLDGQYKASRTSKPQPAAAIADEDIPF